MQMSAGLWVAGFLLILVQYLWRPGEDVHGLLLFVPLILSVVSFIVSVVLGLYRGTNLYRAAIMLGLLGLTAITVAITLPLDRGVAGPRTSPTNGEIVLTAGVALSMLAGVVGAVAIARRRRQEDLGR